MAKPKGGDEEAKTKRVECVVNAEGRKERKYVPNIKVCVMQLASENFNVTLCDN